MIIIDIIFEELFGVFLVSFYDLQIVTSSMMKHDASYDYEHI